MEHKNSFGSSVQHYSALLCCVWQLSWPLFSSLSFFGERCLADAEDRKHFVPEKKSPDPTAHA